jgi:uncharacterized protein YecT (DUF1311 family)
MPRLRTLAGAGCPFVISARIDAREPPSCGKDADSTGDLHECAAYHFRLADKSLNETYARAIARARADDADSAKFKREYPDSFTPEQTTESAVRAAQRAWIDFRDKQCDLIGLGEAGGTIAPIIIDDCFTRLTEERILGLRQWLGDAGGDPPPKPGRFRESGSSGSELPDSAGQVSPHSRRHVLWSEMEHPGVEDVAITSAWP